MRAGGHHNGGDAMLVLTRREDQQVLLPGLGVSMKVLQISGKNIRMGFDAPRHIRIVRGELAEMAPSSDATMDQLESLVNEVHAMGIAIDVLRKSLSTGKNMPNEDDCGELSAAIRQARMCVSAFQHRDQWASPSRVAVSNPSTAAPYSVVQDS